MNPLFAAVTDRGCETVTVGGQSNPGGSSTPGGASTPGGTSAPGSLSTPGGGSAPVANRSTPLPLGCAATPVACDSAPAGILSPPAAALSAPFQVPTACSSAPHFCAEAPLPPVASASSPGALGTLTQVRLNNCSFAFPIGMSGDGSRVLVAAGSLALIDRRDNSAIVLPTNAAAVLSRDGDHVVTSTSVYDIADRQRVDLDLRSLPQGTVI